MCIAAPGVVQKIAGREAWVQYPGTLQRAMIGIPEVEVGDSVLVQMGIIIQKISSVEAKRATAAWESKSR